MINLKFTEKVLNGFKACNVELSNSLVIGAAVSGGADSVALLLSLFELSKAVVFSLKVVTVNHFIREAEETTGDVNFVVDLCKANGIECFVKELQPGEVKQLAEESKAGIEEAARELRYKCFEAFCNEQKIDYLCLAHNKNDQLETVLMRFLQGSGAEGLSGIAAARGKYIRPLLNISRSEIEEYLEEKNQKYRTDSTNFDCNYLRNRIRNKLVPLLNEEFSGWDSGVVSVSQKAKNDEEYFQAEVQSFCEHNLSVENETACFSDLKELSALSYAMFSRVILNACNCVSSEKRIPGVFLQELYRWTQQKLASGNSSKIYGNLEFSRGKAADKKSEKKEVLIIKKQSKQIKDLCFSAIIEESGVFELSEGKLLVEELEKSKKITLCGKEKLEYFVKVDFPFVVKNYTPGDETVSADGKYKKLKDVFSDWKVPEADRQKIMVLQELNSETQKILCIFGRVLGFKDWIVKS